MFRAIIEYLSNYVAECESIDTKWWPHANLLWDLADEQAQCQGRSDD